MSNYYEVTKIVNPCDKCDGKKFVNNGNYDYQWQNFQVEFTRLYETAPSIEQIAELRNKMPPKPALATCPKCKGVGHYKESFSLRDAMIEIMSDANFEGVIQSNREFERRQNEDIPY